MNDQFQSRQRHGQKLYQQNDLVAALAIFDSLVEELHEPTVDLLDNRAATYTKLKDFPKALRDGKRMINLDKTNPAGYLRTGQVLRLTGKDKAALNIYNYGLRYLKDGSKGAAMLMAMRDKLQSQQVKTNYVDPLESLPLELIEQVLSYLDFKDKLLLLRVSKNWNTLLAGTPFFWKHIDLSQYKRKVKPKDLKALVLRGRRRTTKITISRDDNLSPLFYKFLVAQCPKLEYLSIIRGDMDIRLDDSLRLAQHLSTLIIGKYRMVRGITVFELLKSCQSLVTAEFHLVVPTYTSNWPGELPNLRSLLLYGGNQYRGNSNSGSIENLDIPVLLSKAPNLESLDIGDFQCLSFPKLREAIALLHNLRTLRLINIHGTNLTGRDISYLPQSIENLALDFPMLSDYVGWLQDDHFHSLKAFRTDNSLNFQLLKTILEANKGHLEEFYCRFPGYETFDDDFPQLATQGFFLSTKKLTIGYHLTDEACATLALHCPDLTFVEIQHGTRVTGVGIKGLVLKKGSKLKELVLINCTSVSFDAITWAREQGVKVTVSTNSGTASSGRTVRYGN